MTELMGQEASPNGAARGRGARRRPTARKAGIAGLAVGALGVVYGDIGTSPLYAMQTVFSLDGGLVRPTPAAVYGVVSLIFWSITLIVSIKYVTFILRAGNDGEGGVMALAALVRRVLTGASARTVAVVMTLGVLGAALFYGDSVITPAISVLSAVEGLEVVSPGLSRAVVPIATVILVVLFAVQPWGTGRVGVLFGPVMVLWFLTLGVTGLKEVIAEPDILRGLSPSYAATFIAAEPHIAFVAMGAVVLAITGAEALYADMGHFGRAPIRWAWFVVVFPALTLNYLAQGGLILRDPAGRANPFFLLLPHWAQMPMVVLATMATVIASQAVISGAFSVSRQAFRLGLLPRLRIRHTSVEQEGQVFMRSVNVALFVVVLIVTVAFGSSTKLANAYGVAVTGTFLITTTLFLVVARSLWKWKPWQLVAFGVVFGSLELTFFASNLTKVAHGGWLTLLIAAVVFTLMTTWQRGREIVLRRRRELEGSLTEFLGHLHAEGVPRVPGTAVFPHPSKETTPLALRANVRNNHVLHERVVILSGNTANVPHIPWEQRLTVDQLGDPSDGIIHIAAEFGFQDRTDFPEVLSRASIDPPPGVEGGLDPDTACYFVSRVTMRRTPQPGMSAWRKQLFIALAHTAASQPELFCLPTDRTVMTGSHVDL